jgi:carboxylesterase
MLHGFLGSPISSRPLATYLSDQGITVHCPLLPGHGEFPDKLNQIPHEAWIDEAKEALMEIRKECDEVFLMGHSMGSILCAYLYNKYSDFRGVTMLAPVYKVPSRAINLLRILRYIMPWFYPLKYRKMRGLVYERLHDFDPTLDFDDPTVKKKLPKMTRVPTSGIDEMRKVIDMGRTLWSRLDAPTLVFQGLEDVAVDPRDTKKIMQLLPNQDKQLLLFEKAGHELMRPFEPVHAKVWSAVHDFIRIHSSAKDSISVREFISD